MDVFLIEHDDLLEKYNTIWDKVRADIRKELGNKPAFNEECLKIKMKSHGDEVKAFYDKEISKVISNYTCLAVITLDFVFKNDKSF